MKSRSFKKTRKHISRKYISKKRAIKKKQSGGVIPVYEIEKQKERIKEVLPKNITPEEKYNIMSRVSDVIDYFREIVRKKKRIMIL